MAKIGFIGLGAMGLPMAQNLIRAGHTVTGMDPSKEQMEKLAAAGGLLAPSIKEAVAGADVVITMLPDNQLALEIYLRAHGVVASAKPGALLIDCSTIDVQSARSLASAAEARGLAMVDAPTSGGVGAAQARKLTFMVGGTFMAFERARLILEKMGEHIVHAGLAGTGQAAKICNNMILGASMIVVSEAFVLAEKLGLDAQKMFDISSKSSGQCWSMTNYCPVPGPVPTSPANRNYQPGFTAAMMLRDLRLAQDAASAAGAKTPLGAGAAEMYAQYVQTGEANRDFSGIIQLLRKVSSVHVVD
jgi:3-hydroxyisobutyrate dehydrogenase